MIPKVKKILKGAKNAAITMMLKYLSERKKEKIATMNERCLTHITIRFKMLSNKYNKNNYEKTTTPFIVYSFSQL